MYLFANKRGAAGEFVRFCLVGGLCTAIDYLTYLVAGLFIPYQFAVITGFAISFCTNYYLTAKWTFRVNPTKGKFTGMILCHLFNLFVVRLGLLSLLVEIFGIDKDIAYLPVLVVSAIVSFVLIRTVFKSNLHKLLHFNQ